MNIGDLLSIAVVMVIMGLLFGKRKRSIVPHITLKRRDRSDARMTPRKFVHHESRMIH